MTEQYYGEWELKINTLIVSAIHGSSSVRYPIPIY